MSLDLIPKKEIKTYVICEVGYSIEFVQVFNEIKNKFEEKVICINENGFIIDPVKVSIE